jgi:hypothetical protein
MDELDGDCWFGWLWQKGRWKNVCSARDIGRCARDLHQAADKAKVKDRNTFLTYGCQRPKVTPGSGVLE